MMRIRSLKVFLFETVNFLLNKVFFCITYSGVRTVGAERAGILFTRFNFAAFDSRNEQKDPFFQGVKPANAIYD